MQSLVIRGNSSKPVPPEGCYGMLLQSLYLFCYLQSPIYCFLSKQPSANWTLKSCSFAAMFRLPSLLLHVSILQFIPHRLFRWFVPFLCAPTAQTLRTGLIGNNSWASLMVESPINEILMAYLINAAARRSRFACALRSRAKCSYCLPNLSQFLLPTFSYPVFGWVLNLGILTEL